MKEINTKRNLTDAGFDIIAEKYQHVTQYNNIGAQLLRKGCAIVCVEHTAETREYLLDKEEREAALKNPDFLDDLVWGWANNEADSKLAMYRWFPEKIESSFDEDGPCKVLVVGCFFGYEPINWAKNESGEDLVFATPALAQEWIDEQENEPYYLRHGEAGRPEYFIIAS